MTQYLLYLLGSSILITVGCATPGSQYQASGQEETVIDFWNGNRSEARQIYERQVLHALLDATLDQYGPWKLTESLAEYPGDEEALVFTEKGHDLFVTIAGNQKFGEDDRIVVPYPLTRNLLGYRVAIIRETDADRFGAIDTPEQVQQLVHGIPETWSDATIFRHNGYAVAEEGDFEDIFDRLAASRFDYSAYGANEVLGVFENRAAKREGLIIDENLLFFYPFPLVFYINPERADLAERIEVGLKMIMQSGELDGIYKQHYGNIVGDLRLDERKIIILENPLIPENFRDLSPDLGQL
jgi:hypothetical protein